MKKWKEIFYIFMLCALIVSGCAHAEPDASSCKEEDEVLVELKSYTFDSAESAENISDEDLLFIAQNRYQTKDFIKDLTV